MMGNAKTSGGLTRRNFVRVAMGLLTPLVRVTGGYALPAQAQELQDGTSAQATDAGQSTTEDDEPIIVISLVPNNEWDVVVGDLSDPGIPPVPGARVKLTSRYNHKVLDQVSDEKGEVDFKIAELSENPDKLPVDRLVKYEFNGSVEMTCEGYRDFATGLVRVVGGEPYLIGTQPFVAGQPYPRLVTFNEWDALYAKNEFIIAEGNTEIHSLRVQWAEVTGSEVTIEVKEKKKGEPTRVLASRKVSPANKVADTTFKGAFLQKGADGCVREGATLEVSLIQDGKVYSAPLNLVVKTGAAERERDEEDVKIEPFAPKGPSSGISMKWPNDVPILGGSTIKAFSPNLPVNVSFNPWGYLQITIKSPSWGYMNDWGRDAGKEGGAKSKGWGMYPRKSATDQWKSALDKARKMDQKTQKAFDSGRKVSEIDASASISATASFQIDIGAQWDLEKYKFEGDAGIDIVVAFNANFTAQYLLGPIPVYVSFALDADLTVAFSIGFVIQGAKGQSAYDVAGMIDKADWDLANVGAKITINLIPSVSAGVGVKGIFSVGLTAKVVLTLSFEWTPDAGEKPQPHSKYSFKLNLVVTISFLCMTESWTVLDVPLGLAYDNWKTNNLSGERLIRRGSLEDVQPITEGMLMDSCEFILHRDRANDSPDTEPKPAFLWSDMREGDIDVPTQDGTNISYAVYRLVEDDEVLRDQGAAADVTPPEQVVAEGDFALGQGAAQGDTLPVQDVPADPSVPARLDLSWPDYEPTIPGSYNEVQYANDAEPLPQPGVLEIGREGGIVPQSDKVLKEPVFGDPRTKVVTIRSEINGEEMDLTCSLRIASVNVGTESYPKMRPRLAVTILDATGSDHASQHIGHSTVLDFEINDVEDKTLRRDELFDYDFDIALSTDGRIDIVHVVLVSGIRTKTFPSKSSFDQAVDIASNLYFTYLCFFSSNLYAAGGKSYITKQTRSAATDLNSGIADDYYHLISNLRIATDGTRDTKTLLVCYLDRYSRDGRSLLFEGMDTTCRVNTFIIDITQRTKPIQIVPKRSDIDPFISGLGHFVYQLELSPCMDHGGDVGQAYTLNLYDGQDSHFYLMKLKYDAAATLYCIDTISEGSVQDPTTQLVPWPGQEVFLCSYPIEKYRKEMKWLDPADWDRNMWRLHTARWVRRGDSCVLDAQPVGPEGFNISNFGVNARGTFIFWAQTRDAIEQGESNELDGTYASTPEPPLHQLVACRVRRQHFSDPFIAAEVPHRLDSVDIVRSYGQVAPLAFMSRELYVVPNPTNGASPVDGNGNDILHAAKLWYTSVPHLMCTTVVNCTSPMPLFKRGGTVQFHLTIRNDGNTFIEGCKVSMYLHENIETDEDGKVVSEDVTYVEGTTQYIEFKEQIIGSLYNPLVDGKLTKTEPDLALAPGKRSVYELFVTVPEEWGSDGKTDFHVSFRAHDPVLAPDGGMNETSEEYLQAQDSGIVWPTDDDVIYQEYAIGSPVVEPNRNSATPTNERYQHYMSTISFEPTEIRNIWGPSNVTVSDVDDPSGDEDDKHDGGGSMRPDGPGNPGNIGGYQWYESMTTPYPRASRAGSWYDGRPHGSSTSTGSSTTTGVGSTTPVTPVPTPVSPTPQGTGQAAAGGTPTASAPASGVAGQAAAVPQTGVAATGASTLPYTSDETSAALPAALAVAGAAVVAYERRRARNEEA